MERLCVYIYIISVSVRVTHIVQFAEAVDEVSRTVLPRRFRHRRPESYMQTHLTKLPPLLYCDIHD